MKKVLTFLIFVLVTMLTISVVYAGAEKNMVIAKAEWKPSIEFLSVYSGSLGGGWHPVGALTAEIIHEEIPALITKVAPGGGTANPSTIQRKDGLLGMTFTGTAVQARKGLGKFKKPHPDIRHVISMYSIPFWWVVLRKSDINSVADLYNKNISPGRVGQTGLTIATETLKAYNLTFDSIKKAGGTVSLLGDKERFNMLRDRHLNSMSGLLSLSQSGLQELRISPGVRLIGSDDEHIKIVQKAVPGLAKFVVPAGTFDKYQKEELKTVSAVTCLVAHKDLEDEIVYRVVEAMIKNMKRYNTYFSMQDNSMSRPLAGNNIPVHPGAMKYYKERGYTK